MRFISLPLRNLRQRPLRSALTALGMAAAIAGFVALVGMSRGLERAWTASLTGRGIHILAARRGSAELLTSSLEESRGPAISRSNGVTEASGELIALETLPEGQTIIISGWPEESFLWDSVQVAEGENPAPGAASLLIGSALASSLVKKTGDPIHIGGELFSVAGILRPAGALEDSAVIMPLGPLQRLQGKEGMVTVFNLQVEDAGDPEAVDLTGRQLAADFPDLVFTQTRDIADSNKILRLFRAVAWSISTIGLVLALVVALNTLMMSVYERTRELGILSAIGWSSGRIVFLVVLEGLVLAGAGAAAGLTAGIAALRWLAALPAVRGFIEPAITPAVALEVIAAALLLGCFGSAYPAWRATKLNVAEALRRE